MPVSRQLAAAIIVAAITLLASCGGGGSQIEVTTTADGFKQVEAIDMTLQWKISGGTMEVFVHAPSSGWIGVGFDPDTIMKGSNFIIGYVDAGTAYIEDHFGDKTIEHHSDVSLGGVENVTLIGGSEDADGTSLRFSIPLDSGDEYDKPLTPGQKYRVLLAYGPIDDFVSEHETKARIGFDIEL